MRIVAVKRRKQTPGGPADQALPVTGAHSAGVASTAVRQSVRSFKAYLVQEYTTLLGLNMPTTDYEMTRMFDTALQYVHVNLLQDLSPPWLENDFPQALPGEGVLSRYLKPCFLKWDIGSAHFLFGEAITGTFVHAAKTVGLTAVSIVGRPLYVCTQPWKESVCMAMAAMSPLMEQRGGSQFFMCSWCKKNNAILPASGSRPRRVLQLYLQVRVDGGAVTFMRTSPLRIMVAAPLAAWGTGEALRLQLYHVASPRKDSGKTRVHFSFEDEDSERLWLHAVSL